MASNSRHSDPNSRSRGIRRASGGVSDWASADAATVLRAITIAASTGGALRFGYTADGGAYAIGIYGDGAPYTEYVSPHQEVDITLGLIIELFESIADEQATSSKAKKNG